MKAASRILERKRKRCARAAEDEKQIRMDWGLERKQAQGEKERWNSFGVRRETSLHLVFLGLLRLLRAFITVLFRVVVPASCAVLARLGVLLRVCVH